MPEPNKQEIEARAYKLWGQAGQPEDREAVQFWQLAEQQLRNEDKNPRQRALLTRCDAGVRKGLLTRCASGASRCTDVMPGWMVDILGKHGLKSRHRAWCLSANDKPERPEASRAGGSLQSCSVNGAVQRRAEVFSI